MFLYVDSSHKDGVDFTVQTGLDETKPRAPSLSHSRPRCGRPTSQRQRSTAKRYINRVNPGQAALPLIAALAGTWLVIRSRDRSTVLSKTNVEAWAEFDCDCPSLWWLETLERDVYLTSHNRPTTHYICTTMHNCYLTLLCLLCLQLTYYPTNFHKPLDCCCLYCIQ